MAEDEFKMEWYESNLKDKLTEYIAPSAFLKLESRSKMTDVKVDIKAVSNLDAALLSEKLNSHQKSLLQSVEIIESRPELIPLSFGQERLWFVDKSEGSVQYHLPTVFSLKGRLNQDALAFALKTIVNRHEVLRTVFIEQEGHVWQKIKDKDQWELKVAESSAYKEDHNALQQYIQELINEPFDLVQDHMLRACLIKLGEEEHVLVVTFHHIAFDGWSTSIFIQEVAELYAAFEEGRPANLQPIPLQYADYSLWQRNYLQGEVLNSKLQYWKNKLQNVEPLQLPTDYPRPAVQSTKGASVVFRIEKEQAEAATLLSQQQGVTLFMTLLATFKVLLYRYTGQKDICVGTPIAGRQQQELEGLIGIFLNTLALRNEISGELSFSHLLQQVKTTTLEAYGHQEVPFEKVVDAVVKQRDTSRKPLFQVMFVLQNTPKVQQLKLGELQLTDQRLNNETSKLDLTLSITETATGLEGIWEYSTDLYSRPTIERMIGHYKELLGSVIKSPGEKIASLPMLTKWEEHQLVVEFNDTAADYPKDKTIVDLFEEQVLKTPKATAVVFEEQRLSYYAELNARANQLGHYLRSKGVKAETLVPICIERSLEMIVGILGILKAGGAYVPIDPNYPVDRIKYMLEDTRAQLVVTTKEAVAKFPVLLDRTVIEIDGNQAELNNQTVDNPLPLIEPYNLAYVIYTSGSTGKPKGVMIEHCNVYSFICWCQEEFASSNFEVVYASTSICFDLSVYELFFPLSTGKIVRVIENGLEISKYLLKDSKVLINSVPVVVENLLKEGIDLGNVSVINMAGEPIPLQVQRGLDIKRIEVRNLYGPTEDTTYSTIYRLRKNEPILIGRPIANTTVYISGKENELVPIGVLGEICLAGAGLSRGYLNRPELTAEKFIKNPFISEDGRRLYKTGDLGRWLPDGNIEYLGRIDDQVKIRGYRIELGEIESVLMQSGFVKQSVVVAKTDKDGNKRLVGYAVSQGEFDKQDIISYLRGKLPEYMVPALWVELEHLPLTSNRKIDKMALPDVNTSELLSKQYTPPQNELQSILVEIWQRILNVKRVGINDNFFELGGHSLLAIRLISAVRKEKEIELTIDEIFDYPTIVQLAKFIESIGNRSSVPPINVTLPRPALIPLSFAQERLWFIDRFEGSIHYHEPTVLDLKGRLNQDALAFALKTIVNRHEVLRTVFIEQQGHVWQKIKDKDQWQLKVAEGSAYREDHNALPQYIQELINEPFDLVQDDMLRACLIKLDEEEHMLVVTFHHIAFDGWSTSIFIQEVAELYAAFEEGRPANLQPIPLQYADYSLWQRNYLQGEVLNSKLQYWKNKLQNVEPLQLPTDYPRPAVQSTKGASVVFRIEKEQAEAATLLSQQQGVTLFMTLLATFKVLLYRYTGQKDICVGTPIAGRQQQELEGLIGIFLNTLALRNEVSGELSFTDLLQQVKTTTLEAYGHQEVPFEKVVDSVVKQRDTSRKALFQVMFVLQNTPKVQQLKLGELQLTDQGLGNQTSKFDLTLSITETATGLAGIWEYSTDLYSSSTIERMIGHYKELLGSVIKLPGEKIASLPMLTKWEEHQLLVEFNDTAADYPKNKTIVDLFEEQVLKTPEATAVVFEEQRLSYAELNAKANQLGHYLRSKGVKAETLVPICIERSLEIIVGILGILKAGGAYVPIDPNYPGERIKYMLEDTRAQLVVTTKEVVAKFPVLLNRAVIEIDGNQAELNNQAVDNPLPLIEPYNLAYVIYTSGSTGKPKGVMIEHGNVTSLVKGVQYVTLTEKDILLSTGSSSFDATTFEYWSMLLNGGQLVLSTENTLLNSQLLKEVISTNKVNKMWFTSSWFNQLIETDITVFEGLQTIIAGGEELSEKHIFKIVRKYPDINIINGYGPTENTTFSSTYKISTSHIDDTIPIGQPLDNRTTYIAGNNEQLVPIGVFGEIYVGGAGLSRGYLNRPELTAEKFIKNHFSSGDGGQLYKTGDLGRWLPNGNIEYLGRIDDQVKIRGYRIELGEIENVLMQSGFVKQSVVVAKTDKEGNKRLVGYVVSQGEFDKQGIISYLRGKLPEYMIPALWVELEFLPLTSNGKIDKKALPDVNTSELLSKQYIEPQTPLQTILAELWQQLLNVEHVGIKDNFFKLGGHSLLAIKVVSNLRKLGYIVEPMDLFVDQTIEDLSEVLTVRQVGNKDKVLPELNNFRLSNQDASIKYDFKFLVPIKSGKRKLPLYIIAGGGGTVFKFKRMVDLLESDQPVFGLQQPANAKDLEEFPKTIETIAAIYIKEILIQNPDGPIALSGHCTGGIIAFEMSKQLEAMGKKVAFLAMFDTIAPAPSSENQRTGKHFNFLSAKLKEAFLRTYNKLDFQIFLLIKHPKHALEYKLNSLKYVLRMVTPSTEEEGIHLFYEKLEESFRVAQMGYKAKRYEGNLLLYYAQYQYRFFDVKRNVRYKKYYLTDSIKNSWKKYSQSIEVFEIEGEHSTMFDPEVGGKRLAKLLQDQLNKYYK